MLQSLIRRVRFSLQAPVQISELPTSFKGIQERNQWIRDNRVSVVIPTYLDRFPHMLNHILATYLFPLLAIVFFIRISIIKSNQAKRKSTDVKPKSKILSSLDATEVVIRVLGSDYDSLEALLAVTIETADDRLKGIVEKDDVRTFSFPLPPPNPPFTPPKPPLTFPNR